MARPKGFVDPITYSRNVLRSAKYISVNVLKGINPTLTSMIVDTKSEVKEMIDDIKDGQSGGQKMIKDLFGLAYKTAGDTKRNVLDDIRTGKFYNPEREAKNSEEFAKEWAGLNEFDFDIDFDFEDEDDDKPKARGERSMTQNFNMLSTVQQRMAAASSEEITRNADKNTKNTIMASARLFGQLNNSLAHIYNSVNLLHQDLTEPLNTHIKNSANFYSTATDQLAKQTALLENINKMLTDRFAPPANKFESKQSAYEKIFANGFPSVKGLASHVKTKLFDEGYGGLLTSIMDPDTIKMFASMGINSPIALLLSSVIGGKIRGSSVGRSVDRFTNTLTGGFKMVASRIHKYNKGSWGTDKYGNKAAKNGILSFLAQIFDTLPDVYDDKKIDSGKYHKGRTDWTGIDSKALTEVIPMQLAKIYAAISGQDAEIFDYQTGKWVKANKLKSNFNKARSQAINDASIGFKSDMVREYIDDMNKAGKPINYSSRATARFSKDFDTVLRTMVIQDVHITDMDDSKFILYLDNMVKKGVIDRRNLEPLKNMFLKHQMRTNSALVDGRIANNKFIDNIGATHNVYGAVFNDSNIHKSKNRGKNFYKNTVLGITDDKGNDIFFYLQSYFTQLEDLRNIAIHGGFGGGGKVAPAVSSAVIVNASGQPISTVTTPMPGSSFTSAVVPTNKKAIKRYTKRNKNHQSPGRITDENMYDEWDKDKGKHGGWNAADKDKIIEKTKTKKDLKKEEELEKGNPFSRAIDKFTATMKGIFIGKTPFSDIVEERGILGAITALPEMTAKYFQDIFNDFKTTFIDWAKGKWDKFKQTKFAHNFKDGFFEGLGNIRDSLLNHAVESAAGLTQWATGKRPDWAANVITAANGAMINKSGMVSVSEGELIIPSEKNPFYRKKTNKSAQKATEARNYRNWVAGGARPLNYWGSYADGGTVGPKKLDAKGLWKIQNQYKRMAANGRQDNLDNLVKRYTKQGYAEADVRRAFENTQRDTSIHNAKDAAISTVKDKFNQLLNTLFGEHSDDVKKYGKEAISTIKSNAPKTALAGAVGGLIGGALTGSGFGLLGGAAIGVAVDTIRRSDMLNNLLFDVTDEDGNITSKGKLPKKVQDFLKKQLPDLAKSGGLGAIMGAIGVAPGGILGGFALGAGIQLLSQNENIKNGLATVLLGPKDAKGARHGGIVGSIKQRVIDPLSDWIKNGLANAGDYIKKNFFDPILKIFDPLKEWIRAKSHKMLDGIGKALLGGAKRTLLNLGQIFDSGLGRALGLGTKLSTKVAETAGKVVSAPFRALGWVGEKFTGHNIKRGYSQKSHAERLEIINSSKNPNKFGAMKGYNEALVGMDTSSDNYRNILSDINFYTGGKINAQRNIDTEIDALGDKVTASLVGGGVGNSLKEAKTIQKLLRKAKANAKKTGQMDLSSVQQYALGLDSSKLTDDVKDLIFGKVGKDGKRNEKNMFSDSASHIKELQSKMGAYEAELMKFAAANPHLGILDKNGKLNKKAMNALSIQSQEDLRNIGAWDPDAQLERFKNQEANALVDEEKQYKKNILDNFKDIGKNVGDNFSQIILQVNRIGQHLGAKMPGGKKIKEAGNRLFGSGSTDDIKNPKEEEKGSETVYDSNGRPIKMRKEGHDYEPDTSDPQTAATLAAQNEETEQRRSILAFFTGGGFFTGMKRFLGLGEKDEEKGESFLSKLVGGIKGIFSGITGTLGTILKSALSFALPAALVAIGYKTLTKISDTSAGNSKTDNNMQGYNYLSEEEQAKLKQSAIDEQAGYNGLEKSYHGARSIENTLRSKDMGSYKKDDYVSDYYADRFVINTVKNGIATAANPNGYLAKKTTKWLLKGGPVKKTVALVTNPFGTTYLAGRKVVNTGKSIVNGAKSALKNTSAYKTGAKALTQAKSLGKQAISVGDDLAKTGLKVAKSKIDDVAAKAANSKLAQTASAIGETAANSTLVQKIAEKVTSILKWVGNKMGVSMADDAGTTIATAIGKLTGGKSASQLLKSAAAAIQWVFIANAITEAMQDAGAKEILHILDKPTTMQKVLAMAVHGLNNAIPYIGGLIPSSTLVTIFYNVLKNFIDFGDYENQRTAAEQEIAEYNEANGTTYDFKEYLYNVKGEATLQTRVSKTVGKAAKTVWNGVKGVVGGAAKAVGTVAGGVGKVVGAVGKGIGTVAKAGYNLAKFGAKTTWNVVTAPARLGIAAAKTVGGAALKAGGYVADAAGNVISTVGKGIGNFVSKSPIGTVAKLTSALADKGVEGVIEYAKEAISAIFNMQNNMQKATKEKSIFDFKSLWNSAKIEVSKENPFGSMASLIGGVLKVPLMAVTFFKNAGGKIGDLFKNIKNLIPDIPGLIKATWEYGDSSKHENMDGYEETVESYKSKDTGVIGNVSNGIVSFVGGLMKLGVTFTKPFRTIGMTIANGISSVISWFGEKINAVKKAWNKWVAWIPGIPEFDVDADEASSELSKDDSPATTEVTSEETTNTATGGSSGIHTTQKGNRRKFGRSSIDKNGCGPASAATILKAYGKNANINSAADYAIAGGYVAGSSGVGTRASYFRDIFGANGISSSYTTSKKSIANAIGAGNPTVLLGTDASNRSKSNSPFGPNPHYVVARGSDARGNILIDDPELGRTALYNKKILNNAKLGVITGGASGVNTISSDGGATTTVSGSNNYPKATNNIEAIWAYYKQLGLSDGAVAGILGNIHHESGSLFNTTTVEHLLTNHLMGKGDAKWAKAGNIYKDYGVDVSSYDKMNETYTAAIDAGKISSDEFQHPYKMLNDPNYKSSKADREWMQFGYGLTQFTYPAYKEQLYNNTVAKGKSIGDLIGQLDVITDQLKSTGVWGTYNSNTTYAASAENMLRKYERPSNVDSHVSKRVDTASKYYNQYQGKNYDISDYTSNTSFGNAVTANSDTATANTLAASASTTGSSITSLFSNFFGNLFGTISNKASGKAGSLLKLIFGGTSSSSSSESTTTGTSLTNNITADGSIDTSTTGELSEGGNAKPFDSSLLGAGTPTAFIKIAQSQMGVKEGSNKYNEYGKLTGQPNAAWCASFVSWCMDKAFNGNTAKRNAALRGNVSAAVSGLWSNFKNANAMTNSPQPGDILIYKELGKSHTGLVESVNGNNITTIEGNTSGGTQFSSNGGICARKSFDITDKTSKAKYLTGFGRPDWDAAAAAGSGLPIYNFTGRDTAYSAYKAGASGTSDMGSIYDSTLNSSSFKSLSNEKKLQQILIYLKQIVSNTGYNVSIPEIVDVLKDQADIISNMSSGSTVISQGDTNSSKDKQNEIDADISKMMAKLDAITQAL